MKEIKKILMERDDMTERDADELIEMAMAQLNDLISGNRISLIKDVCRIYFKLEPQVIWKNS